MRSGNSRGKKARAYQQKQPELNAAYCERREHAIRRAAQRYGLELSFDEYEALCNRMPDNKTEERYLARRVPHPKDKPEVRHYAVFWKKARRWLLAVYSFRSFQIVTFMPPEFLPKDLPPADEVIKSLERGKTIENLREKINKSHCAPVTLEGHIAWDLLDMPEVADVVQARVHLKILGTELNAINTQINMRAKASATDGDYGKWLDSARWAIMWRNAQISALKAYITLMEQRARRLSETDTTEALLAGLVELVFKLDYEKRAEFKEGEFRILSACKQRLWDLGWQRESRIQAYNSNLGDEN